ncbi:group II intron maturase-specific domain-containing protein [Burkholderia sp. PAMC 26561]|uniref:group II intron maturase-specific domain-containing protein n=1 Tax=Burkholderia sp. PAMC 26561 TaxID=1795043 RepID=UPI00076B0B5A|nr:group II intron maturase-specific domain-containing protein [Burkholderia sp. PAMC 26561]AME28323.1 hypothetical protein AXG89_31430 [Burkholderia sp. PAMC 26561]
MHFDLRPHSKGFDFLGQNVRKYRNKLLIKPSKKNGHAFLRKIRSIINENRTAKQQNLIGLLNPVTKGWADYHRHFVSKRVYARVDSEIWRAVWQWCCRWHPNKGRRWIKHRYFDALENGIGSLLRKRVSNAQMASQP